MAAPGLNQPVNAYALKATLTVIKAEQGAILDAYEIYNPNASVAYVQLFDIAIPAEVVLGTTVPNWAIPVAATSRAGLSGVGLRATLGWVVAVTTTATGSTAPGTGLDCSFGVQ